MLSLITQVRRAYRQAIMVCEAHGVCDPADLPWRVLQHTLAIRWLLEAGIDIRGHPETPAMRGTDGAERGVMVTPGATGGAVDERLEGLEAELTQAMYKHASDALQTHDQFLFEIVPQMSAWCGDQISAARSSYYEAHNALHILVSAALDYVQVGDQRVESTKLLIDRAIRYTLIRSRNLIDSLRAELRGQIAKLTAPPEELGTPPDFIQLDEVR